jgi:hypothetical protein
MTTPIRITTADEESSVGSSSVLTPVTHTTNFTHVERMDAGTDTDSFTDITATTMASDDWTAPFVHVVVHHHHQETADTPTTIALEEPHQQPTATPVTRNSLRQANTTHLRMTAGLPVGYQTRVSTYCTFSYSVEWGFETSAVLPIKKKWCEKSLPGIYHMVD